MTVLAGVNSKIVKNGDPAPAPPAAGTIRIYNMRFCPWAQRALIYASVKNIPSDVINVHLQEKPDWYFSKHYKGQVPTLEHDEGKKHVIESAVIPEYLDDIYPETRILPTDPYEKVQQKLLLDRISGQVSPAFYGVVQAVKNPDLREEKFADIKKAYDNAEQLLTGDFYSGTSKPGFVDYLLYPNIQRAYWAAHIVPDFPLEAESFPGPNYPRLSKWYKALESIPEVAAASQPTENGVGFFKDYLGGSPNYDYGL
ncbi:Glutathione S-transferase omega [Caenorhabditis elegans]|uniref:Glutathione S-transferase omega n=1 Tax=Caenorhabditis elegans TaxID=6239 RepID=D7SFI3_CAEEL|nr:Glutathione S-transferase omega [Caenorhabditis elegans]CCD62561.1 Glutathione S-transferase omega [Caenorhabditis elegans]|eukprot:NP_001254962.1 Uncharacterized protein CELE_C02D5.4 [Caenorhabditis elegans]